MKCISCGKEIGEGVKICEECSSSDSPRPGGFLSVHTQEKTMRVKIPERKEPTPTFSEDLVQSYQEFSKEFYCDPKVVYYPCCGNDASPIKGFPNCHIIFVDKDEASISALKKEGYDARNIDVLEFIPEDNVDIVILLNPQLGGQIDVPLQQVREGGYVICNNYHHTAFQMRDNLDFKIVGVIDNVDDKISIDKQRALDSVTFVDTDEEFKRLSPEDYEEARVLVQNRGFTDGQVLTHYKDIVGNGSGMGMAQIDEGLYPMPPTKAMKANYYIFQRIYISEEHKKSK